MDFNVFSTKKIPCQRHPKEILSHICTIPDCQYNNLLLCPKCQTPDNPHYTHHKRGILKIKDFLEAQLYLVEPSVADELILRTLDIEKKIKLMENDFKNEDSEIDKDFGALFALFFKISDTAKTTLKKMIRESSQKLAEKNQSLNKALMTIKNNKTEAKDVQQIIEAINPESADHLMKSLLNKKQQKYEELSQAVAGLIAELENCPKERITYKKSENGKRIFEEIKDSFEKACLNVLGQFRSLLEDPTKKSKKADLSKIATNSPLKDRNIDQSVAKIAQDIERSRNNLGKSPLKIEKDPRNS